MRIYVDLHKFVEDSRMTRNEELDLLQNAELKQAFDEFDKVHLSKTVSQISKQGTSLAKRCLEYQNKVHL